MPAPGWDRAEPAGMERGREASLCPRRCHSHGVTSPRSCCSDSRSRSSAPPIQVPLQHPWLRLSQGGNTLSGRAGPAGTSPRWTSLLSTDRDQRGRAERSRRTACTWPACSGGFLNESTNRNGVKGARNCSNSRAWGRSATGTVRAWMQPPMSPQRGTLLSHSRRQSETRPFHCLHSKHQAVSQQGLRRGTLCLPNRTAGEIRDKPQGQRKSL